MRKDLLLFLMLMISICAYGQQEVDTLRMYNLQEVSVISTRASKVTPVAFTTLSKDQIEAVNFGKDVPQLLNMLPSVTMSSDAGMGIGYTGIHIRGTDPTRINVSVNGISLNDSESAQLYWVNMADFASSLEDIQVQRGVGTSTNGFSGFGAIINMKTEKVGIKPFLSVSLSGGSYGTHKETVRFSTGLLHNHWGVQGRVSNIGSDGYVDRASSRLNSYFLQGGYYGEKTVVEFMTFSGWEKTYMAWDYLTRDQMKTFGRTYNPSGSYTAADGNTVFYDNQTDNYHQQHYHLMWNQHLSNNLKMSATAFYTRGDGYYEQFKENQKMYKYLLDPSVYGKKNNLIRQKKMANDYYGVVVSANYTTDKIQAVIGGIISKYDGDHYGKVKWVDGFDESMYKGHKYYDNNAKKTDGGNMYGKLTYEVIPGLHAFADIQYRYVNYKMRGTSQEFDGEGNQRPLVMDKKYYFFNPKFGISYKFLPGHMAFVSYAVTHKEPTRNDFEDMLSESVEVDPKRERLNDLEIGYKYENKNYAFGANLYYMDYDNQFVLTGSQDSNGEMVARNIKDSYRLGLELTGQWSPFKGFLWDVNATLSRNRARHMHLTVLDPMTWEESVEDVGSTHLSFSPDFILNNVLSYTWKDLRISVMSKYVGEQYMTNTGFRSFIDDDNGGMEVSTMLNDYFTTDVDLTYTFKPKFCKRLTLGLTVYNVFSKKYESNGACGLNFRKNPNTGKLEAFNNHDLGFWTYSVYSPQAPCHVLGHLSVTF